MKRAKMRRAVTAATPPPAVPDAPAPADATPAAPVETPDDSGWADASTAVLCYITDAAIVQSGFDPNADPPEFVPIGAIADLDRPSVEAAVAGAIALDDEEDEGEGGDAAAELFVLVWGDPTKPENLTAFPEDSGGEDEPHALPAPADAAPDGAPAQSATMHEIPYVHGTAKKKAEMAVDDGVPVEPTDPTVPDDTPDDERTMPTPGPLGMFEACLVTEGVLTDEVFPDENGNMTVMGRELPPGIATWRTPPLPGGFAMDEMGNPADMGHANAPIACNALTVTREGNRIMARGPYADNPAAGFLKAAVDNGAAIAPSIDLGASDVWDITTDADGKTSRTLLSGSIAGFVVLPYEAQHSADGGEWLTWFRSAPDATVTPIEAMPEQIPAAVPVAASAVVACGAESFGAPLYPPRRMLEHPPPASADEYSGITIVDDGPDKGHVYGAVAGGTCHLSFPGTCLRVSDRNMAKDFAVFHKGLPSQGRGIKTAEGDFVGVGQITMASGHADISASATEARTFYDNTGSVIANGTIVWSDVLGAPWFSGCLVASATEADVQMLRGVGEVSVDYRELEDGRLHLVHLLAVPRGGFPPMRALSAGGELKTLILAPSVETQPDQPKPTQVTADALMAELGRDFYIRRLAEEGALLASAHAREAERLGALVR